MLESICSVKKMGSKSKLPLSRRRKSRRKMGKLFRNESLRKKNEISAETTDLLANITTESNQRAFTPTPSTSTADVAMYAVYEFSTPLPENRDSDHDESISHVAKEVGQNKRSENDEMGGRRLINVSHFLQQAMNFPHHSLFSCDSKYVKLVREIRRGFVSKFILKCEVCQVEHTVEGDKSDGKLNANGAAVTGIINIGCGFTQLNEFASALNMPGISFKLYKRIEDDLNEIFHNECWQSMIEAGKEEAKIVIKSGNVDDNNVPLITVIADGAWCRRSYRTNYNAKSGAACIVGKKTGKILFLGICNKSNSK